MFHLNSHLVNYVSLVRSPGSLSLWENVEFVIRVVSLWRTDGENRENSHKHRAAA